VHHIDAGAQLELFGCEMRFGARARARIIERAGRGFGARDQIRNRADAGIRAHEQHVWRVDQFADRRKVLQRIVRQVLVDRRIDGNGGRGEQQRVAVRLCTRCDGHAGIAAPAAPVVHDHRLTERFLQTDRNDAGNDVGRTSGRKRYDERDDPFWIGGMGERATKRQCQCRQNANQRASATP